MRNCRRCFSRIRPIYLDYQATTPMDPRVTDAMLSVGFGNPHSRSHEYGWEAESRCDRGREQIAELIGANPKEIIFTSGATESNNLAIKGVVQFSRNEKIHLLTLQTEHKCVLSSFRELEARDPRVSVTYLKVKEDGIVDIEEFVKELRPETLLVSCMLVNNEIGVIQPVEEIGKICRERGIVFHSDAAQGAGKIEIDVNRINCDLMSLSSHKIYGPMGIGALYVRRKPKRIRLRAQIDGGGQERGLRSGTLATALVVGFGEACELGRLEMKRDERRATRHYNYLYSEITKKLKKVILNGSDVHRYRGNLNLSFTGVEGESLLMALQEKEAHQGVAISSGSACTSASLEPSYVLRALGVDEELAHTSLRFGIGRFTTDSEVRGIVDQLVADVERLRDMSPLWEISESRDKGEKPKVSWS